MNLNSDEINTNSFNQINLSNYKKNLLNNDSYHSRTLVKFVDLSICVKTIKYIFENFTEDNYSFFF